MLSFEGVQVQLPPSLVGVDYKFTNGNLVFNFKNFTGEIKLQVFYSFLLGWRCFDHCILKSIRMPKDTLTALQMDEETDQAKFHSPCNKNSTNAPNGEDVIDDEPVLTQTNEELSQWSTLLTQKEKTPKIPKRRRSNKGSIKSSNHLLDSSNNSPITAIKTASESISISPMSKEFAVGEAANSKVASSANWPKSKSSQVVPESRWGHTATMISPTQMVGHFSSSHFCLLQHFYWCHILGGVRRRGK
jgi:hypothetical protein